MAARQVLETTELLEAILCELPCTRLLLAQRVCKKWDKVVRASKPLSEVTFRRAVGPILQVYLDPASQSLLDSNPHVNPTEVLSGPRNTFKRYATSESDRLATVPIINPFLQRLWQRHGPRALVMLVSGSANPDVDAPQASASGDRTSVKSSNLQEPQSWETMLLTQPPTRKVTILNRSEEPAEGPYVAEASLLTPFTWVYTHTRHTQVENDNGITLGDIVTHLRHMFGEGSIDLMIEPLYPMLGSYWRQVDAEYITAATLPTYIRLFDWAADGESPVGWYPVEDGVSHLGGPLDDPNDMRRLDEEREATYYRVFAGRRGGIGVIRGKPVYGPERPPRRT